MKRTISKFRRGEKGQALVIVMILMLVGGLIITPLMSHMSSGIMVGKEVYEERTSLFYAADSGVEDGLWQIKHGQLESLFTGYDEYNYNTEYPYSLPSQVNVKDVNITVKNEWMPKDMPGAPPDPTTARNIIEGTGGNPPPLMIVGGISGSDPTKYQIGITYNYGSSDPNALRVITIGIWLPPGFHYDSNGHCSLADDSDTAPYAVPATPQPYKSGEVVVWSFSSLALYKFPPNTSGSPMVKSFTFSFTGPAGQPPSTAISWVNTTGGYTWDADKQVYKIISTAIGALDKQTIVEAYAVKSKMRELGTAMSGDYVAIGNSLMMPDPNNSPSDPSQDWRSRLLKESSATIQSSDSSGAGYIPAGATIEGAYLYWSGFIDHYYWYYKTTNPQGWNWIDDNNNATGLVYNASNLQKMVEGWTDGSGKGAKVNTVSFNGSNITTHNWQVWPKTNDSPACWYYTCFYDATDIVKPLIESGASTFTFTLGHATTVISQNPPRPNFPRIPSALSSDHTSPGYSFYLYNSPGSSTVGYTGYPLGTPAHKLPSEGSGSSYQQRYHASYAGWSLVIIYSSPETLGHQLYLYDIANPNFIFKESYPEGASQSNPDFDGDGVDGGKISGFLVPQPITGETNAARMTCFVGEGDAGKTGDSFKVTGPSGTGAYLLDGTPGVVWNDVWNSKSVGLTAPGVDIDTFYVTWSSGILAAGNTWAQVDIPTTGDGFTLSYIILSFRSTVTTGGTISYLVRG